MSLASKKKIRAAVVLLCLLFLVCAAIAGFAWWRTEPTACKLRGAVDSPKATVDGRQDQIRIEGWAADLKGISRIEFWAAGRLLSSSRPTQPRNDVLAAFPACKFPVTSGFVETLTRGAVPPEAPMLEVRAVSSTGTTFVVGQVKLDFSRPIGVLDIMAPIQADAENLISGWAVARQGPVKVKVLAQDRELLALTTVNTREDVHKVFPAWQQSAQSGFEGVLSMRKVPRGRYKLRILFGSADGAASEIAGPEVINDLPIGKVLAQQEKISAPGNIQLRAWLADEDGIQSAQVETETGVALGDMALLGDQQPFSAFTDPRFAAYKEDTAKLQAGNPLLQNGALYQLELRRAAIPPGLQRIQVRVADKAGNIAILPGPLVLDQQAVQKQSCDGEKLRLYYPGGVIDFRKQFPQMRQLRAMVEGSCVEVGFRGRVEYLRTTKGEKADYVFDPNFPERLRHRDGKEMTGDSLAELLDTALRLRAPLMLTLDGGVWADAKFSAPDVDVVDMLERDESAVQWNQFGKSEPDDALKNLAGATDSPELARMMSLNHYNRRFLDYKKRNLQAAVREIVKFNRAHPGQFVMINLDPDLYINPWFYLTQWYDYNPGTLRQYREWLFHLGPYADGGALAASRREPRMTLADANRMAAQNWSEINAVEPPRKSLDYGDAWQQSWTQFKRHLVARHYDDLAAWAVEAGLPPDRIYTSQTFIQPDVAVTVTDRATGWTDQAGVSIEGAKPRQGHLGAILYGPASRNLGKPRSGASLIENVRLTDPQWGVVEFHPGTISFPEKLPSHGESYSTMSAVINHGARFLSPMWGSFAGDRDVRPNNFKAYDVMEGSAFEYQLVWWLRAAREWPAGSLYFPFGNPMVSSTDGWSATAGTQLASGPGALTLSSDTANPGIQSPQWGAHALTSAARLVVSGNWPQQATLSAELSLDDGQKLSCLLQTETQDKAACSFSPASGRKLSRISLSWQLAPAQQKEKLVVHSVLLQPLARRQ
ncbi:hypothetical protein BH11PSE11_BH11PSE11_13120 [soil metagenome]